MQQFKKQTTKEKQENRKNVCYRFCSILTIRNTKAIMEEEEETKSDRR